MRRLTPLAVVTLTLLLAPAGASGAECGDDVPCGCGDTLRGAAALSADLGPCDGDGLVLRGEAVLDCHGHTISGRVLSPPADEAHLTSFGIVLDGTVGAVVRNCRVSGFHNGIELSEAKDCRLIGLEAFRNGNPRTRAGYGIHVSRSQGNLIQDCLVHRNADEGIHVGSGSDRNTLVGNRVHDNTRENVYVLSARGTRLQRNHLWGEASSSLYMKHATDTLLEGNRFDDRPVVVRGAATGNLFIDNTFEAGLKLQAYGRDEPDAPSDNVVRGGRLEGERTCLELLDARDNRFEDVSIDGCHGIIARAVEPRWNDLLGIDVSGIRLELTGGATLRLLTPIRIEVRSSEGGPLARADVDVVDASGEHHEAPATDGMGSTRCGIPVRAVNAAGLVPLTPVVVTVSAAGHAPARSVITDPPPKTLTLTLDHDASMSELDDDGVVPPASAEPNGGTDSDAEQPPEEDL